MNNSMLDIIVKNVKKRELIIFDPHNEFGLSEYDDFREKILKLDSDELVIEGTDFQGTYNYVKIYKRVKQQMA